MRKMSGAVAAVVAVVAMVAPATAKEVTVTSASCFPIGSPPSRAYERLVKDLNARGAGVLKIDMKGGAPAIGSPFTLTQKMSRGAYDMVGCTEAYFGNVLPEAPVFRFSEYTYAELRRNGGLDYAAKLLAGKNIHYVARHDDNGPFHLWMNKRVTKPDLTGLHIRVSPVYTAFIKALGGTTQTSNIAQVYTYMENGTVQGFGWPSLGWVPTWAEVTKYRLDPGFYSSSLHTLVNLRKWKALPQPARDLITKVGLEYEEKSEPMNPAFGKKLEKIDKWYAEKGIEILSFAGADREKWLKTAFDAGWKEVLDRSPEHGPKLKSLFTRQ